MFISILYMFRAAMCPSSGELLYQFDTCFMSLCVDDRLVCRLTCIPDGHLHRVTQIRCRTDTIILLNSLHVSGSHVPIIGRIIVSMRHLIYVTLCRWPPRMQVNLLAKRSSTQSDINQVSHWYNNSPKFSTCFGQPCAHHQENYCINATPDLCHSV